MNTSAELYPIEKGIPMVGRPNKYPWKQMEIGDSFLVRCAICDLEKLNNSLTSCRNHAQRMTGWKFSMRRSSLGIRVWRVDLPKIRINKNVRLRGVA